MRKIRKPLDYARGKQLNPVITKKKLNFFKRFLHGRKSKITVNNIHRNNGTSMDGFKRKEARIYSRINLINKARKPFILIRIVKKIIVFLYPL